jgi:hypothetical protein
MYREQPRNVSLLFVRRQNHPQREGDHAKHGKTADNQLLLTHTELLVLEITGFGGLDHER